MPQSTAATMSQCSSAVTIVARLSGLARSQCSSCLLYTSGWHFVDVDAEIEAAEGTSILRIFETRGEVEFRRVERAKLREHVRAIECGRPAVLALGGGAIVQPENFTLLENNGVTIWLDCPFETVRPVSYTHLLPAIHARPGSMPCCSTSVRYAATSFSFTMAVWPK